MCFFPCCVTLIQIPIVLVQQLILLLYFYSTFQNFCLHMFFFFLCLFCCFVFTVQQQVFVDVKSNWFLCAQLAQQKYQCKRFILPEFKRNKSMSLTSVVHFQFIRPLVWVRLPCRSESEERDSGNEQLEADTQPTNTHTQWNFLVQCTHNPHRVSHRQRSVVYDIIWLVKSVRVEKYSISAAAAGNRCMCVCGFCLCENQYECQWFRMRSRGHLDVVVILEDVFVTWGEFLKRGNRGCHSENEDRLEEA